jgi:S-disulfanyl-L-cysteine oxidoreductase SoxD
MCSSPNRLLLLLAVLLGLCTAWPAAAQTKLAPTAAERFAGIGRAATTAEVAAWDIDVRADFKGLPRGRGSVAQGQVLWEAQCANCHGIFGESNEVFSPLVGGTSAADIASGRVARLNDASFPGRTTLMKLSSLSTLWDYVNRAMPWNAPKSLKPDEVYAVTAYMLNLGGVVGDDFVLSDTNMQQVQSRLPNRNGKTTAHALWPGAEFGSSKATPDLRERACMSECVADVRVASSLPDHARNAHGNLALQQRLVGPMRGADTTQPPPAEALAGRNGMPMVTAAAAAAATTAAAPQAPAAATPTTSAALALARKHNCTACHAPATRGVGPAFDAIARKYAGRSDAADYLAQRIRAGGSGVWGSIPMPPQSLPAQDAKQIAAWLSGLAP